MPVPVAATDPAIESWLAEAVNLEKTGQFADVKLDRMQAFMAWLPPCVPPLTVTGTKGKGSTLRLIEQALLADGQATVSFTSPHLAQVRERWRIDGEPAGLGDVAEACTVVDGLERAHHLALTYFERCFAIACLLSAARPRSAFLCEVGLGGRLDCANTLDARVLVLTHLSRDHCAVLGDTLEQIAGEKLALARAGRPVVIAPQGAEGARAVRARLPAGCVPVWVERPARRFELALPGDHQQANAATALVAARLLRPGLDEVTARRGLAGARLAGRCQLVERDGRRLLIDGAHNGASMRATMSVAASLLRPGWRLVLGVAKDKDLDEILESIPPEIVIARAGYASPRARLAADWPGRTDPWPWYDRIAAALAAQPPDVDLCVSGSLYLAAEALEALGLAGEIPG